MDLLLTLPWWYLATMVFCLGVIIGSFLNVYLYRFNTGKSIVGSSHCLSCQTRLRWFELFPLLSYIFLRGQCRCCGAYIPSRYFWVELATGLLFVAVLATQTLPLFWPLLWWLVALLVVITVYDMYHMVIPQRFIVWLWVIAALITGLNMWFLFDLTGLLYQVLAAAIAYIFFAGLWKVSGGRWIGYGDAKLAPPLGFLCGLGGVFSMLVLAFWVGTIISLGILAYQHLVRRASPQLRFLDTPLTIKSEVPFAPFLIAGFLLVYLGSVDVLVIMSYVIPL